MRICNAVNHENTRSYNDVRLQTKSRSFRDQPDYFQFKTSSPEGTLEVIRQAFDNSTILIVSQVALAIINYPPKQKQS